MPLVKVDNVLPGSRSEDLFYSTSFLLRPLSYSAHPQQLKYVSSSLVPSQWFSTKVFASETYQNSESLFPIDPEIMLFTKGF